MLVFYCCITDDRKFIGFNKILFIVLRLPSSEVCAQLKLFLAQGLLSLKLRDQAALSCGGPAREGSAPQLPLVIGRILFLDAVELMGAYFLKLTMRKQISDTVISKLLTLF